MCRKYRARTVAIVDFKMNNISINEQTLIAKMFFIAGDSIVIYVSVQAWLNSIVFARGKNIMDICVKMPEITTNHDPSCIIWWNRIIL